MKMFEILWEWPKRNTEIRSEQMCWKKMVLMDFLEVGLPQNFNLWTMKYLQSTEKWHVIKQGVRVEARETGGGGYGEQSEKPRMWILLPEIGLDSSKSMSPRKKTGVSLFYPSKPGPIPPIAAPWCRLPFEDLCFGPSWLTWLQLQISSRQSGRLLSGSYEKVPMDGCQVAFVEGTDAMRDTLFGHFADVTPSLYFYFNLSLCLQFSKARR